MEKALTQLKHRCVNINTVLAIGLKHSTIRATTKKTNSTPARSVPPQTPPAGLLCCDFSHGGVCEH